MSENEWPPRREISLIQNLLEEEGDLSRIDIGDKYRGPLRFRAAGCRRICGEPH